MGKQVSELVGDDLKVYESGAVTSTFHYVTNYTEFSDAPDEQSGYYFPFHLTKTGTKMTFKVRTKTTGFQKDFDITGLAVADNEQSIIFF